jgi:hypothetical protein
MMQLTLRSRERVLSVSIVFRSSPMISARFVSSFVRAPMRPSPYAAKARVR